MPRLAYITELDPIAIAQLQAAQAIIQDVLENIQVIQVPEDGEEATWEDEGGPPAPEPEEERVPDPQFMPPAPLPPINHQADFGAGPPPNNV